VADEVEGLAVEQEAVGFDSVGTGRLARRLVCDVQELVVDEGGEDVVERVGVMLVVLGAMGDKGDLAREVKELSAGQRGDSLGEPGDDGL
jgi:hypothetical protein